MLATLQEYYFQQGLAYAQSNHTTFAINMLEKAVMLDNADWKSRNLLGLCYYRLGDFDCARKQWQTSLSKEENDNSAVVYLHNIHADEFLEVCEIYNKALELSKKGKYGAAVNMLQQQRIMDLKIVMFTNLLGLCRFAMNKKHKALESWGQALAIDKEHPLTLKYIREALSETKRKSRLFEGFWKLFQKET